MTHKDAADYSKKHGAGEKPNPAVAEALTRKAEEGRIPCARVFEIVSGLGVTPSEAGRTMDLLRIKLVKCQLGLFGYEPGKSILKPAAKVSPELKSAIRDRLVKDRLSCADAWKIADEQGLKKIDVSSAAEALGVRIKPCQLGAF